jgi:hypothetical protein
VADHNCPIARGANCPYPGTYQGSRGQCNGACVDSWDGDHCYVKRGDRWVWTSDDPEMSHGPHSVEFVANVRKPHPPGPRPGAKPVRQR